MIAVSFSAAAVLGGGAWLLWSGARRAAQARFLGASGRLGLGSLLVATAAALGGAGFNLATYQRLTYEQPVGTLRLESLGGQRYRARLTVPAGGERTFELVGDEWQLDARVLKWRGWINSLGIDARYRLERLSGRHSDLRRERTGPRTVHDLASGRGLDLWRLARGGLPGVDARYGSSVYLPLAHGAAFEIRMTQSGLVARPLGAAGAAAMARWPDPRSR